MTCGLKIRILLATKTLNLTWKANTFFPERVIQYHISLVLFYESVNSTYECNVTYSFHPSKQQVVFLIFGEMKQIIHIQEYLYEPV